MQNNNSKRHGLSADESRALCQKVLGFAKADHTRVNIASGISGFTRTAINRVTTAGETNNVTGRLTSAFGKRVASVNTNRPDHASLQRAVRGAEAPAKSAPEHTEDRPELGGPT